MKKLLKKLLSLIFIALIVFCAYFAVTGYLMYKNATKDITVSEKVKEIRRQENYIVLDNIPDIYENAVISAEDSRFYSHKGVDLISLARATFKNIKDKGLSQGGSTITQQLAKNMFFTNEKSFSRKAAELFVVYELEDRYSKDVILELYINTVYYGGGNYGILDASKDFFQCLPEDMTEYEATYLAGLPNAPSLFYENKELAKKRHEVVLNAMVKCDVLTDDEKEEILDNE